MGSSVVPVVVWQRSDVHLGSCESFAMRPGLSERLRDHTAVVAERKKEMNVSWA